MKSSASAGRRARPKSSRPSASSPRSTTPTRTRPTRRPRSVSPRSTPPMRSSATRRSAAQFDRGEIGADGKPRFQGFEGFGPGQGGQDAGGGARTFRWSTSGADGDPFSAEDILSDIFGGFAPRRCRRARGGARQRPVRGEDVAATVGGDARAARPRRQGARRSADRTHRRRDHSAAAPNPARPSGSRARACPACSAGRRATRW